MLYVTYKDPYCWLYFSGGEKFPVEISLINLLKKLPQKPFFRCNRTELFNIFRYNEYKENPARVVLEDGTELYLSVRNHKVFKKKRDIMRAFSLPCPNCSDCKNGSCRDYRLFTIEPDLENNEVEIIEY